MSKMKMPESGKFSIGLKDNDLKRRLIGATVTTALDKPAQMTLTFAGDHEWLSKLQPSEFPEKMDAAIKNETIFDGKLTGFSQAGSHKVQLIYQDALYAFKKAFDHSFVKANSLGRIIDTVCGLVGASCDKKGDFSSQVPSFSLEGKTLFDHMMELSHRFGFFFKADERSGQIQAIRAGSHLGEKSMDLSQEPHEVRLEAGTEQLFEKLKIKLFSSKNLETVEKELGNSQLYGEISQFQEHSGFQAKKGWKSAGGTLSVHQTDNELFEGAEKSIPFALSKRAIQEETLRLSCFGSEVRAGQALKLQSSVAKHLTNGKYFVLGCHYELSSAIPKVTITGVRS